MGKENNIVGRRMPGCRGPWRVVLVLVSLLAVTDAKAQKGYKYIGLVGGAGMASTLVEHEPFYQAQFFYAVDGRYGRSWEFGLDAQGIPGRFGPAPAGDALLPRGHAAALAAYLLPITRNGNLSFHLRLGVGLGANYTSHVNDPPEPAFDEEGELLPPVPPVRPDGEGYDFSFVLPLSVTPQLSYTYASGRVLLLRLQTQFIIFDPLPLRLSPQIGLRLPIN